MLRVDWTASFRELQLTLESEGRDSSQIRLLDLLKLDVGSLLKKIVEIPTCHQKYGYLPLISELYIGSLMSASFVERVKSVANLVMTDGRTLPANDELEMVTVLRINRTFMEYMKVQSMRTRTHARTHSITYTHNHTHALTHTNSHTHTHRRITSGSLMALILLVAAVVVVLALALALVLAFGLQLTSACARCFDW